MSNFHHTGDNLVLHLDHAATERHSRAADFRHVMGKPFVDYRMMGEDIDNDREEVLLFWKGYVSE